MPHDVAASAATAPMIRWPRVLAGAALVSGSWYGAHQTQLEQLDVRLGDALRRARFPVLERVVVHTTDLGSLYGVLGIAAGLAATRRRDVATDVLLAGLVTWNVAQASKTRVRRQRPYEAHGVRRLIRPPTGSSFPSGHAAVAAAVLTLLTEHARPPGPAVLRALACYVPASRVYLGVHFPTDVVGGAGLGLVVSGLWGRPVAGAARATGAALLRLLRRPPARAR